jgi:hypothetical protein
MCGSPTPLLARRLGDCGWRRLEPLSLLACHRGDEIGRAILYSECWNCVLGDLVRSEMAQCEFVFWLLPY